MLRLCGILFFGLLKFVIIFVNKGEDECWNGKIDIGCIFVLYVNDNFYLLFCNFFMLY